MNAKLSDSVAQASLPAGYGSIPAPGLGMHGNLGRDAQATRTLRSVRYNGVGLLRRWIFDVRSSVFSLPFAPRSAFRVPRLCLCLCLLLSLSALSAPALSAANPYLSTITNRNVFSLKPPVDPASLVPAPPAPALPPVKLAGITTLLGGKRAILRVARPARPPAPAGEDSLMLAEGAPEESGIKVLEIDISKATVRISNNGTIQTLDLDKDAPKSAPAPAVPTIPPPGGQPAIPVPQPAVAPGGGVTSVARPIRGQGSGPQETVVGGGPSQIAQPLAPEQLQVPAEVAMINYEAWRMRDKEKVEAGEMPPYPPTELSEMLDAEGQTQAPPVPGL